MLQGSLLLLPKITTTTLSAEEPDVASINGTTPGYIHLNLTGNTSLTQLPHAPVFQPSSMVRVVVLIVIGTFSLVANVVTLWSIRRSRKGTRSMVYFLLAHLAVADLLVTAWCVLAEAVWTWTVQWLAGEAACKAVKFLQMYSLYSSTFMLVVMAFDRYSAVRFPMRQAGAKGRIVKAVSGVWIVSALLSSPQVFIFRVQRGPFQEEFYQCVTYGFYSAQWQEQLYTTISLVLMFLLPLVTLVTTYLCTFYTISVQRSFFEPAKPDGVASSRSAMDGARRKLLHKAKMKSLMITVVIVLAFIICWTPYYCMMIIFIFLDPDDQLTEELQAGIFFFGSSTAMINPLIYGVFHLRRRRHRGSKQFNSSMTSRCGGAAAGGDYSVLSHQHRRTAQSASRSPDAMSTLVNGGRSVVRLKYSLVSNGCLRQKETALVSVQTGS